MSATLPLICNNITVGYRSTPEIQQLYASNECNWQAKPFDSYFAVSQDVITAAQGSRLSQQHSQGRPGQSVDWLQARYAAMTSGLCSSQGSMLKDSRDDTRSPRVVLPAASLPTCATAKPAHGQMVQCIPSGCREGGPVSARGASTPLGAETLPSWATVPSCLTVARCPGMRGWPSHLAALCASDWLVTRCIGSLPPPADPATVPDVEVSYEASDLEREYLSAVQLKFFDQPKRVCDVQDLFFDPIAEWVAVAESRWEPTTGVRGEDTELAFRQAAGRANGPYSHMVSSIHRSDGSVSTARVPLEPLAGLMRHPFAGINGKAWCKTDSKGARSLYDWRYLATESARDPSFALRYPGRKVLIDLGATTWGVRDSDAVDASIADARTYADIFGAAGIEFDMVFGWEMNRRYTPAMYFQGLATYAPQKLDKHCFASRAASPLPGHLDNALEMITQLWRPGDYFVFKLDIDNRPVEEMFIKIVAERCPMVVAELIYEQHAHVPELNECCWHSAPEVVAMSYGTSLRRFKQLRELGIRAHFWV